MVDPAEDERWSRNRRRVIVAVVGGATVLVAAACSSPGPSTVAPSPTPCVWDVTGTWSATADGGFLATQPDFEISLDVPAAGGVLTGRVANPGGFPSSSAAGSTDGKTIELHTTDGTPIGIAVTVAPDGKTASGRTTDNANVTLTLFSRAPQCR